MYIRPVRLLLTGFEPFGGSSVNPSERCVRALADDPPAGVEIATATLPCVDGACEQALLAAVHSSGPDAVIALGEHGRESALAFERLGVNLRDYRIPDNAGATVRDEPVVAGAPAGYFSTLPVRSMCEAAVGAGVPARLSRDAGTFLCNQALFALLHAQAVGDIACPACFVHVPRLPEQSALDGRGQSSMTTSTACLGLRAAIGVLTAGGLSSSA